VRRLETHSFLGSFLLVSGADELIAIAEGRATLVERLSFVSND